MAIRKRHTKIWFCSDLFFGMEYGREVRYPDRDSGFEKYFMNAWSHSVTDDDIVCILGNAAVKREAKYFHLMTRLPGRKCLVLGPEDKQESSWYEKWRWNCVVPFGQSTVFRHQLGNILLSHIPAYAECFNNQPSPYFGIQRKHEREMDKNSAILNIHGHLLGQGKPRNNTIDVSLEATAFAPRELEGIIQEKFK